MAKSKHLPTIWRLPDEIWTEIKPLLEPEKPPGTPGRPAVAFRQVLDGILYVLRTGCQGTPLIQPRAARAAMAKLAATSLSRQWMEGGAQRVWIRQHLPPSDSRYPFSQRLPGSMYRLIADSIPESRSLASLDHLIPSLFRYG